MSPSELNTTLRVALAIKNACPELLDNFRNTGEVARVSFASELNGDQLRYSFRIAEGIDDSWPRQLPQQPNKQSLKRDIFGGQAGDLTVKVHADSLR